MHSQKSDKIQNLTPTKSAIGKVEKILKGSLNWIPSPSLNKKFVDNAQQCFAFTPQANFPAHILNFYFNINKNQKNR